MKLNQRTSITGNRVVLVPYRKEHVERYHEWMKSEELQRLTASEPLSLEDEYAMQHSWSIDEDKCTFIVLSRQTFESTGNEVSAMIGDVNLFLNAAEPQETGDNSKLNDDSNSSSKRPLESAEIEVMIAEPAFRRSGHGLEATLAMMKYGVEQIGAPKFVAKVDAANEPSLRMFREKLNFKQTQFVAVFNEVVLEWAADSANCTWLAAQTQHLLVSCAD